MSVKDDIRAELRRYPNTPSNIAKRIDASNQYVQNLLRRMDDVEKLDRGLYRLDAPDAGGVETAEQIAEITKSVQRLSVELAKGTETKDELIDRADSIRKRLESLIED